MTVLADHDWPAGTYTTRAYVWGNDASGRVVSAYETLTVEVLPPLTDEGVTVAAGQRPGFVRITNGTGAVLKVAWGTAGTVSELDGRVRVAPGQSVKAAVARRSLGWLARTSADHDYGLLLGIRLPAGRHLPPGVASGTPASAVPDTGWAKRLLH